MKWDQVCAKIAALVAADPTLRAIYGGSIRMTGTGEHRIPLLEYMLVADGEDELWAAHTIQWDQFTKTSEDLVTSERRLRHLFHREVPAEFGGLAMWSQYVEGEVLAYPARDKYYGRAIRFRMTPLRERYEPVTT